MTETALDALVTQYETYPYPARNPKDEAQRLITGSPSALPEIAHYLFGGKLPNGRPFRVLVAGGGTGDGLVMLAQYCADAGIAAEITYLDLSRTSRDIAGARLAARGLPRPGLGTIDLQIGSLLDPDMGAGLFDYIDCCGVLHHLPDPNAGLAALKRRLAPGGGMGLMVYAPYGRTGVYPLQDALKSLTEGMPPKAQVALAKRVLKTLGEGHPFRRNPFIRDHLQSDAGLYDLLLHSRDRPYSVDQLFDWIEDAGLAVTGLIEPALYDPANYLPDPRARDRLSGLSFRARAALAEHLSGAINRHIAYVARREDAEVAVARYSDAAVPVPNDFNPGDVGQRMKPGQPMKIGFPGLSLSISLPRLAPAVLGDIDGRRSIRAMIDRRQAADRTLARPGLEKAVRDTLEPLIAVNKVLLSTAEPT